MKHTHKFLGISLAASLALATSATAQVNLLVNGNFEDVGAGTSWSRPINSGWTSNSNFGKTALFWADQPSGLDGPWLEAENLQNITAAGEGIHAGYIWDNNAGLTRVSQSVTLVSGTSYTLTGLLGNPERTSSINNPNGAIASVFIDGIAVASELEGDWSNFSHTFTATGTSAVISYGLSQSDNASQFVVVDNLVLAESVPEPSSTLLLGLGSLGLIVRRKRA